MNRLSKRVDTIEQRKGSSQSQLMEWNGQQIDIGKIMREIDGRARYIPPSCRGFPA